MQSIINGTRLLFWNMANRRLRAFWRIVIQFAVLVGLLILSSLFLTWSADLLGLDPIDSPITPFLAAIQTLMIAISVVICSWLVDRRPFVSLGMQMGYKWNRDLLLGFMMGGIAMSILFGIEYAMGWIEIKTIGPRDKSTWGSLILYQGGWLTLMICVGISEELLSRGYHFKNIAEGLRWFGSVPAVVWATLLSSSVFGLLHMGNPNANVLGVLGVFMAGLMLAMGRITTGSLAAPIGLHISWNYFQGPVLGFAVSGNPMQHSLFQIKQLGDPLWTGGNFGPEAGLLGVIAICVLSALFLVWPNWKQRRAQTIVSLAHFRLRRKPDVNSTPSLT